MLPLSLLEAAKGSPMLIELKNGIYGLIADIKERHTTVTYKPLTTS
jgi:hypothetical protein